MNLPFVIAGVLCAIFTGIHLFGREHVLRHMATSAFPAVANGGSDIAKQEVRVSWHGLTVIFGMSTVVLLLIGLTDAILQPLTIAHIIIITYLGFTALLLIVPFTAIPKASTWLRIPQWVGMLLVASFTYLGTT